MLNDPNGSVFPQPPNVVVGPPVTQTTYSPGGNFGGYNSAAQNENALVARSGRVGDVTSLLHAARLNYARQQLAKYRAAAGAIGGNFQASLQHAGAGDPIATYKALSGVLSQMAQEHGYVDPRVYLHNALNGGL